MALHVINQNVEFSSLLGMALANVEEAITVERSQTWWNRSYTYRRVLSLPPNEEGFDNGHPLFALLSKDLLKQRKIRSDYEDIEVLRLVSSLPETWQVLKRRVEQTTDGIKVTWASEIDVPPEVQVNDLYYIYYGNSTLVNQPTNQVTLTYDDPTYTYEFEGGLYTDDSFVNMNYELSYIPNDWPVSYAYDSSALNYTRPGQHWIDNQGVEDGAKVTLQFYGSKVRIVADKGPDYGIAEVQIDDADWIQVDLHNYQLLEDQVVYSIDGLLDGYHVIRFRRSGFKNPAAGDYTINIKRIDYMRHNSLLNIKEETDESLLWGGSVGGTVGN